MRSCAALAVAVLVGCGRVDPPPAPGNDPTERWSRLLATVVTDDGLVRYDLLRADSEALRDFVGWVAVHGPETDGFRLLDDNRRLAWHLNAYNAIVLWRVLQEDPLPRSVRDIPGFFWWQEFGVDRAYVSLYNYERRDILPTYQEPLSHAALNCASRSCPPLRAELYHGFEVQNQLGSQVRRWIRMDDPTRAAVSWDPAANQFVFSPIFDWYARDFRQWGEGETPCDFVRPYAENELRALLGAHKDCPHRFYTYDWSLNGA